MSNVFSLYADFDFLSGPPICIGQLECESFPGRGERYRFSFSESWLSEHSDLLLNPSISLSSPTFSGNIDIPFIADSMPDRWGRALIIRREAKLAEIEHRRPKTCRELDFLLSVEDFTD